MVKDPVLPEAVGEILVVTEKTFLKFESRVGVNVPVIGFVEGELCDTPESQISVFVVSIAEILKFRALFRVPAAVELSKIFPAG